jgi:hypothetical protein
MNQSKLFLHVRKQFGEFVLGHTRILSYIGSVKHLEKHNRIDKIAIIRYDVPKLNKTKSQKGKQENKMSEGLNHQDNEKAIRLRYEHNFASQDVVDSQEQKATSEHIKGLMGPDKFDPNEKYWITVEPQGEVPFGAPTPRDLLQVKGYASLSPSVKDINKDLRSATKAYDANLWQAHEHKNEHLDQYIESARQEAEAQGVHIDLEQPKE